jgi:polynucleotide 5'-kinase involved in rRNA processing
MLPLLSAAGRLVEEAYLQQTDRIIYDTTGLIDKRVGGFNLKLALIDLLEPVCIVTFQKHDELKSLIEFLRRTSKTKLYELEPVQEIRRRYMQERQNYRRIMYEQYFANKVESELAWTEIAVSPEPRFHRHQLAALEDRQGYVLTLGIVDEIDTKNKMLKLISPQPVSEFNGRIDSLRLGSLSLDPESFREQWL